jgi:hypothetical protein
MAASREVADQLLDERARNAQGPRQAVDRSGSVGGSDKGKYSLQHLYVPSPVSRATW